MRIATIILCLCTIASAQSTPPSASQASAASSSPTTGGPAAPKSALFEIPAGTKVPLALKQAISTKSAKEGDSVYCETTFPVVQDGHMIIPAGTYVQGKITHVQRAGRVKGRAEVLMHFTTLIYPNGYTVMLPGSVDNIPGADSTSMKGTEGTVQQDGQKAKDVGQIATTSAAGAAIGGIAGSGKGALIGAASGGAVGTAIALLTRGNDVKLDDGASIEMVIQREVTLDPARMPSPTVQTVSR
jgi:type IV secretion system protein VirB10